jgi:uncharacterized protein (TIGR03067 family)
MKPVLGMAAAAGLVICTLALTAGAGGPADEATKKEYDRFEGTWTFVSVEMNGQKVPVDALKDTKLVLKGNTFAMAEGKQISRGTYKVDLSKKPKHIDATFNDGPEKGKTLMGIYELKGDIYKVCISITGKDRPKDFVSTPDSGHVLEVLKRQRP